MCDHSHGGPTTSSVYQTLDELEFEKSIHYAALDGNLQRIKYLLERDGDSVKEVDKYGYTPLHYASRSGNVEICRVLIVAGADVDARTGEGRQTSLHRAALRGHDAIVKLLLDAGADRLTQDADGETPLDKAYRNNQLSVIELLRPNNQNG